MAQCAECKTIMKTGVAIQRDPRQAIEWICKQCWKTFDYSFFTKSPKSTVTDSD